MALPTILPIAPLTSYADIWALIDSNFGKSVESLEIEIASNKVKLYLFDGTSILSTNAIPYPVTNATNGLNKAGTNISLGGTLTGGTTINTSTFNFLVQNGIGAQRLRITNTFAELAGALELRIAPPSIDASTAIVDQILKVKNASTGECDYDYIVDTDFTSLSIVGDKVRLTFKDATYLETAAINLVRSKGVFTKNNIATATAGLVNVFTLIAGATTAGTLTDFTHNALGRLTYTGANAKVFKITRNSSIQHTGANNDVQLRFYKNGVAIGVPQQDRQISNGVLQNRVIISEVSLSTGDYVECYAANIMTGALNMIENYCTCIIEEI